MHDKLVGENNNLIVLCYHSVGKDNWFYNVGKTEFENQIKSIMMHYAPIKLSELFAYLSDKKKLDKPSFVLTFDDGYRDVLSVKNFLKSKKITPAIFALSNTKGAKRDLLETNRDFLTNKELIELKNAGWEIGCHSATHATLSNLKKSELEKEIIMSKINLEKDLSLKINFFAYPKGQYSDRVLKMVKKSGYKLALSMDDRLITKQSNKFKIPRIGVNKTHSLLEFQSLSSPSVIRFRKFAKPLIGGLYGGI